ncbi:rRNA maturation RNase YbeY [Candidatus Nomurabacteria bacterium]|jgi:rRNA maturation RNase YbeY|nr:MAG: rRNA maturation RNase YbeY [Candidatus Nomurabacteria bacterium]
MYTTDTVAISSMTKGKLPSLPLVSIKNAILGETYDLSIIIATPAVSKKFNFRFRKKDKPTTILSFSLSPVSGELMLELGLIKKEAKNLGADYTKHLAYLLIHGMLHLKGMEHSSKMDTEEERWKKHFHIIA